MPLWLTNGKLAISSTGKPILCDVCPCGCPFLDEYQFSGFRTAKYSGQNWDRRDFTGTLTKGEDYVYSGSITSTYVTYNQDGSECNTSTEYWTFYALRQGGTWVVTQDPLIYEFAPRDPPTNNDITGTYKKTQYETVPQYCDWPTGSYDLTIENEYTIS